MHDDSITLFRFHIQKCMTVPSARFFSKTEATA